MRKALLFEKGAEECMAYFREQLSGVHSSSQNRFLLKMLIKLDDRDLNAATKFEILNLKCEDLKIIQHKSTHIYTNICRHLDTEIYRYRHQWKGNQEIPI